MHYSKVIILLGVFSFFACKNETTPVSTPTKPSIVEAPSTKQMDQQTTTATTTASEPITQPKIKEVATTPQKKETIEQPKATAKPAKSEIKVKEVKEQVVTKPAKAIKKVLPPKDKIEVVEVKKETPPPTQKASTTLPTPPSKPSQPVITNTAPAIPSEKIEEKAPVKETVVLKKELTHATWDGLLKKYVSATGKVNYKGLKADNKFDAYLQLLRDNPIQNDWSRNKKMAYWINAYNAFTMKLIADNYPVSSITNLHSGKPWDHKWITLGDQKYTLNDIEHKILRPQFKDARIHFAVNCAATSCPPVLNKAWTASNLNSNLEKQTKLFINNAAFNSISENKVELSKIFEWYGEDFGNLISYINKYANTPVKENAKVSYKDYDWGLNE